MILPSMRSGLGLNYTQMGFLASGNFAGYLVAALLGGLLAARFGPRLVVGGSLILTSAALVLTGLSPSFEVALVMRTITGVSSAGANVPAMGLASAWFAAHRRGAASGFMVAGSGVGVLLSGQAIPRILQGYGESGWRYSWVFLGLVVVVLALVAIAYLRNRPEEKGLKPIGWVENPGSARAVSGRPASWRQALSTRAIWHLALIFAAFGFSYIIYATFFAAYLEQEGLSAAAAGDLWALVGVLSLFSGVIWGAFSDLVGRGRGLAAVFTLLTLSFLLFALVRTPVGFLASAVTFGLAAWSVPAIVSAAAGDYVEARLAPAALGFMTFIFGLGQAVGPGVAGYIGDAAASFASAFLLAGAVAMAGVVGSLALRPPLASGARENG